MHDGDDDANRGALTQSAAYAETANTVTVDNLVYTLSTDGTNTATVTGYTGSPTTINIPEKVTAAEGGTEYTVTAIAAHAIEDNHSLISVQIPSTVTSIGEDIFRTCTKLTSITVDSGNQYFSAADDVLFNKNQTILIKCGEGKAGSYTLPDTVTTIGEDGFELCSKLTSITIPSSVTSIGKSAFSNCTGLNSITIPNGVTSIGESAFYYCTNLTSVTLPDTLTDIGDSAFNYCNNNSFDKISIPTSVRNIGEKAFRCTKLKSITIPEGVESIGANAFEYCDVLGSVTISSTVKSLGESLFNGCTKLNSTGTGVTIAETNSSFITKNGAIYSKDGKKLFMVYNTSITDASTFLQDVTSIARCAFNDCKNVTTITIPSSVTDIEAGAFYNCEKLAEIKVDESNANYISVDGVLFNKDKTTIVFHPNAKEGDSYNIPNTVTTIGVGAFYKNQKLVKITISNGVTKIEDEAFYSCNKLSSIEIPAGVTSIGKEAFAGSGLNNIVIPEGVKSIGSKAFTNCSSLKTITIPASVESLASDIFKSEKYDGSDYIETITFGGTKEQWEKFNVTLPTNKTPQTSGDTGKTPEVVYQKTTPTPEPESHSSSIVILKPTVIAPTNGKITLLSDNKTAIIVPDEGYEIASVILNGENKGTFPILTELKASDKIEATFQKSGETLNAAVDAAISRIVDSMIRVTVPSLDSMKMKSAKTAKGGIKVVMNLSESENTIISEFTDLGYTVKYKFYRSTKKSGGYKAKIEKDSRTYINTAGKKGMRYYYKARIMVYDAEGNLIAGTALKNCRYTTRKW